MGKAKFTLSRKAAISVLKSEQMRGILGKAAESTAKKCGDGFEPSLSVGWDRHRGRVTAKSAKAKRRQARNHVIQRAVGGG